MFTSESLQSTMKVSTADGGVKVVSLMLMIVESTLEADQSRGCRQ